MKAILISLVVGISILILGASGFSLVAVKVGDIQSGADAPFYIGIEKGYFQEAGIDVKLETFASAAQMMAPLSSGELHVAGGGISPGLFNAFARGLPVKIVASRSREVAGLSSVAIMIRADLEDKIRRPADLKGRKVAVNAKGSPLEYTLGRALEKDGLGFKDLEVVYIPWPEQGVAFANKAIDAGLTIEPFNTLFQDKGYARLWMRGAEAAPNHEIAVIFYNKDWAARNSQAARDFMVAYIRAARDFYEAMTGGKVRDEVIDILAKRTLVKDKKLYQRMQMSYQDPNGTILKESIGEQQEWFFKKGDVPRKVSVEAMVDESFLRYALEKLGRYTPKR